MTDARGQSAVELVALLPVVLVVVLAAASVFAGLAAEEQAGSAAQAGAMAVLQGGDPREAARRALPAGTRSRAAIEVRDGRVTVRVRPGLPVAPLAEALSAETSAVARAP